MYSKLGILAIFLMNVVVANAQEVAEAAEEEKSFSQVFKDRFIEGGPAYMAPILLCLIIGLAVAIERIIYLTMATTNTKKLLEKVEDALKNGGPEAAKEICAEIGRASCRERV